MQLDKQTIDDLNFEITLMLEEIEDLSVLEDYWMAVERPDYEIEELRRVDINIYDTAMFGDEGDTGLWRTARLSPSSPPWRRASHRRQPNAPRARRPSSRRTRRR